MTLLSLFIILSNLLSSHSKWNETGHRIIAMKAYETMTEENREMLITILKKHPFYKRDFLDPVPKELKKKQDIEKWQFSQMAVWPDIIRDRQHPANKLYHKWRWHFINLSVFPNKDIEEYFAGKTPANTTLEYKAETTIDDMNIIQVLDYISNNFDNQKSLPKAIQLCWIFHLVGDLHQPLHSSALYTKKIFKEGDRGGNSILDGDINLHSRWDRALGDWKQPWKELERLKKELDKYKTESGKNYIAWLYESNELAKEYVYTEELMDSVLNFEEKNPTEKKVKLMLEADYTKNMEKQSRYRAYQAAVRLTSFVKNILK